VTIQLTEDLQLEYESWLDVKESLGIEKSINSFLYYTYNYGTFANPRNPEDDEFDA
jgi:membrane-bound lytic murein transglycosylase MltF